jgi:hypothetical protein|tara:strand:- start:780 stop:1058 length:279 start_codon:yes stop_codon:yes gene_type:complete
VAVGYAVSLLGDVHAAEDAAQEAFVTVFVRLEQLTDPFAFPASEVLRLALRDGETERIPVVKTLSRSKSERRQADPYQQSDLSCIAPAMTPS